MNRRAKIVFYIAPVLVWLVLIFLASTQMGAEQVTLTALIKLLKMLTPEQAATLGTDTVGKVNFLVRKCAHLTEYAILALLAARAIQFGAARLKWQALAGGLAVAVTYAATDEFHQSFVPGRTSSIRDVLIDSVGSLTALLFMFLWFGIKAYERQLWKQEADIRG